MRFTKVLEENPALERYIRLKLLNYVVRPARHLEQAEMIAATELRLDQTLSKFFREILTLSSLKSCTVETAYGAMHYYDSAPGSQESPLVLLHGIGSSGQCFALMAAMLKSKRRVVLPDLFHFSGFSVANNSVMSIPQHVEAIETCLDSLQVSDPVDFCGLSMGGWIGMRLAARRPDLVNSLFLLNPGGARIRPFQLRDTFLYLSWRKFCALYPGLMCAFPYAVGGVLGKFARRSMYRTLKTDAVKDLVKTIEEDHFVDPILKDIQCKVLLLWGREDRLLSQRIPQFLSENIKRFEGRYVEKCAHILCLEAPVNVYDACNHFWNLDIIRDGPIAKLIHNSFPRYPESPILPERHEDSQILRHA